ncbi:MAG: hypothetical protein IJ710_09930 [Prevotella sp.]|nr:hypothetical protein [Prevotella sp.]
MKVTKDQCLTLAILALMGTAFFLLNYYSPLRADDYYYQFFIVDHYPQPADVARPICSMSDVFHSQVNHYFLLNGRFTNHFVVQSFVSLWGKGWFNVCTSVVFVLFLVGTVRLVRYNQPASAKDYVLIIAVWWVLQPQIGCMYNGVAFPVNYLWAMTLCVYFLLAVLRQIRNPRQVPLWHLILLFLFALLTGSTHEGFTIPISGALFLYSLYHRGRLGRVTWVLIIGLWIGTAFVALAPGTLYRANHPYLTQFDWGVYFAGKLEIIRCSKRFYLMVCLMLTGWAACGRLRIKTFIQENSLVFLIIAVNFAFILLIYEYMQRMEFLIEYLSIIVSLKVIYWASRSKWFYRFFCPQLLVILIVHVSLSVYLSMLFCDAYRQMIASYLQSTDGVADYHTVEMPYGFGNRFLPIDGYEKEYLSATLGKSDRMRLRIIEEHPK